MSSDHIGTCTQPLHIEGTTLEGGGQILRLAVGLSALTRTPIHITNIRGKRHGGGGLKAQHLTGVQFLGGRSGARMKDVELKSREIILEYASAGKPPGDGTTDSGLEIEMRDLRLDSTREQNTKKPKRSREQPGVEHDCEVWDIHQSTPGAVTLVFQAILPYALFSSTSQGKGKIKMRITGGTNVSNSPSYEYASQVLIPMLAKIGIPPIESRLLDRGWSSAGRDKATTLGEVEFVVTPLSGPLPAFRLVERGDVVAVRATILAPASAEGRCREVMEEVLCRYAGEIFGSDEGSGDLGEGVDVTFEDSGHVKRYYLLLVATTSTGMRIGRDWLYDGGFKRSSVEDAVVKRLVNKVVMDLGRELKGGGCVDEYLRDQLVVFQGLAGGRSEISAGMGKRAEELSLHARTAMWVAEKMLGVEFDEETAACEGLGYVPGYGAPSKRLCEGES